SEPRWPLINPSTSPNQLNATLMPHSINHGDACFAYVNKIRGIPSDCCEHWFTRSRTPTTASTTEAHIAQSQRCRWWRISPHQCRGEGRKDGQGPRFPHSSRCPFQ